MQHDPAIVDSSSNGCGGVARETARHHGFGRRAVIERYKTEQKERKKNAISPSTLSPNIAFSTTPPARPFHTVALPAFYYSDKRHAQNALERYCALSPGLVRAHYLYTIRRVTGVRDPVVNVINIITGVSLKTAGRIRPPST